MRAVRVAPPVLALATVAALATSAHAGGWETLQYSGTATINGTEAPQIRADSNGASYGADDATVRLSDRVDPRRADSFIFTPSPSRHFKIDYKGQEAECRNTEGGSVYANMVSLYGPDFGNGGQTTGAVRCVLDGSSYEFRYDNGVSVSRVENVWQLRSAGPAKVSKQGANGKWAVVDTTNTVQFNLTFTASSPTAAN